MLMTASTSFGTVTSPLAMALTTRRCTAFVMKVPRIALIVSDVGRSMSAKFRRITSKTASRYASFA